MANASGFVDFNQFAEQNQDEESRLMEEAMARAEAADQAAQGQFARVSQQSRARYGADGQLTDTTGASQTASYADYLKAKKTAASAWAALNARSKDPRLAALQGSIQPGGKKGIDFGAKEAALNADVVSGQASVGRQRVEAAAAAEAKRKAEEERAKGHEEARGRYLAGLTGGAQARAAAGGAQRNYVGAYNPYASSPWAQQQGAWEAQQVKNAGGSEADQRGVWGAYTGKGSVGGQAGHGFEPMKREMATFALEEEED